MLTDLLKYFHRVDYLGPYLVVSVPVGPGGRHK